MLRAGLLRERVKIQSLTRTEDAYREAAESWTDVATVRAHVRERSAAEIVRGEKLMDETRYTVTIRYRAGLTTRHRLVFNSLNLKIHSILDIGVRNRRLDLVCSVQA